MFWCSFQAWKAVHQKASQVQQQVPAAAAARLLRDAYADQDPARLLGSHEQCAICLDSMQVGVVTLISLGMTLRDLCTASQIAACRYRCCCCGRLTLARIWRQHCAIYCNSKQLRHC